MQIVPRSARAGVVVSGLALASLVGGAAAGDDRSIRDGVRYEYPSVLARWAAGEADAALEQLAALEASLVGPDFRPADVEALWRAKLAIVRDLLAASGDDVLVPVMMLHHDVYLVYRDREQRILAQHSRVMAEELAQVYAERKADAESRGVAGSLLTSLGGYLQHGWSWRHSAELFDQATAIWSGSDAAHLGLGALYERRAEYSVAAEHFRQSLAINPDNAEARLRLGVCLKRLGDVAAARAELAPLAGGGAPAWVEILAIEELAELLAAGGADPEGLLRQAIERHPDHSRLRVQLAHWLDRNGRGPEAAALLEEALLRFEPEAESPRYYYSRWPSERLEAIRITLREAVSRLQPLLATSVKGLQLQGAL